MVSYRTKAQYISLFEAFAQTYPNLVKSETIGRTVRNNPVKMYRIGNPNGGKVFFDGQIHGQSFVSSELLYLFAKWLLESDDPLAIRILERNCVLLVPIINYDLDARVNVNGVDLNRNFPTNWGETGSSTPGDWEYRGLSPASEPETQAIVSVFVNEKPVFYINHHNWGGPYMASKCRDAAQQSYQNSIYNAYVALAQQRGAPYVYTDYRPSATAGGGGLASTEASLRGINGWIWETCDVGGGETYNTPPSLDRTINFYFPSWLPMAITMCQACEVVLPPSCTTNLDCPAGFMCVDGECVKAPTPPTTVNAMPILIAGGIVLYLLFFRK